MLTKPGTPWFCTECGFRVNGGATGAHICDIITLAARADDLFARFLATPEGGFASYLARNA